MKKITNKKYIAFVLVLAIAIAQGAPAYAIFAQADESSTSTAATVSASISNSDSTSTAATGTEAAHATAPTPPAIPAAIPHATSSDASSSIATASSSAGTSSSAASSISNATSSEASTTATQPAAPTSSASTTSMSTTTATSSATAASTTAPTMGAAGASISGGVTAPASPSAASATLPATNLLGSTSSTSTATSTAGANGSNSKNNPTIQSGKAIALANILNIVNTNLVNSKGAVLLQNFIDDRDGGVDFRNAASSSGACAILSCNGVEGVQVHVLDDAQIHNALVLQAASGDNRIRGGNNASILTGDAYAGLNLVNIANTNLIDSNYLLITLNAFKDVNGDITFPNLGNLFTSGSGSTTLDSTSITDNGNIENNVSTNAESGMNHTSQSGTSTIKSGDSHSSANVFNQLNSSLIGGDNVSILIRVHGNWAGQVFGAPSSLELNKLTDGGMFLTNQSAGNMMSHAGFSGNSTSSIVNDVALDALTGVNRITGASNALISTGNAFAGANLVNISNANVIGRNWVLAIINIFGDFKGNITFGRPDLWVGEQIIAPGTVQNGSELTFKSTIINNGDSAATHVRLANQIDASHIDMIDSSISHTNDAQGRAVWDIGTIPPGGATEVTFRGRLKNTSPGMDITNTVSVAGVETDNNMADNTDTATIQTTPAQASSHAVSGHRHAEGGSSGGGSSSGNSASAVPNGKPFPVELTRMTSSASITDASSTVAQELVVHNPLEINMSSIVLHDILYGPDGKIIQDEKWDVGDLLAHEEVTIKYDIDFGEDAPNGVYSLSTVLSQPDIDPTASTAFEKNGMILVLNKAKSELTLAKPAAASTKAKAPKIAAKKKPAVLAHAKRISALKTMAVVEPPTLAPEVAHAESDAGNIQSASAAESIPRAAADSIFDRFISAIKVIPTFVYTKINSLVEGR
ncbi:MAG: hypothetical protein JWO73_659 [Candidatus Taylorbacteria bacterium]|nr:hypothetical protein [Candidatus Taylorbacteria bacterium]